MPAELAGRRRRATVAVILVVILVIASVVLYVQFGVHSSTVGITAYDANSTDIANLTSLPGTGHVRVLYLNSTAFANESAYPSSTLTFSSMIGAFYVGHPYNYFQFFINFSLTGHFAPNLQPEEITISASDVGPYNNSAALFGIGQPGSLDNLSTPNSILQFTGNNSSAISFDVETSSSAGSDWHGFSLENWRYQFLLGSYAGNHLLRLNASLLGLSRSVWIQQSVKIMDVQ